MNTLLLDQVTWDLVVDSFGNIAMAQPPYALAQDAASACRLFEGELWYDTTQGVPYWQSILGQMPPLALLRAEYEAAAKSVPDVVSVKVFIAAITRDRVVSGQVQITSVGPEAVAASFGGFLYGVLPPPGPNIFTLDKSLLGGSDVLG
jgi:hypothetical protein